MKQDFKTKLGARVMTVHMYKSLTVFCLILLIVPVFDTLVLGGLLDNELPVVEKVELAQTKATAFGKEDSTYDIPGQIQKVNFLNRICRLARQSQMEGQDAGTIAQVVEEASEGYGVSPELVLAVIVAESNCNLNAISKSGAMGIMQIMPTTAMALGIEEPLSLEGNIHGGVAYMAKLLDKFHGDTRLALAAYNSGPEAVERYRGVPPFEETRKFVTKVMKYRQMILRLTEQA